MNKFEEKFRERLSAVLSYQKDNKLNLAEYKRELESLQGVKLEKLPDVAVEAIKNRIDQLNRLVPVCNENIERFRTSLELLRSICPHEDVVYDSHDNHKNEDYYRCILCGDIN